MKDEKKAQFESVLLKICEMETPTVNIVMHDNPDPDAMGSALGLQLILKLWNSTRQDGKSIESTIFYRGDISHPQNKTLLNVLSITGFKKIEDGVDIESETPCIVVDGTEKNSCSQIPTMVIDHHKNTTKSSHTIISPEYGSCSTIIWELFSTFYNAADFVKEDYTKVFTALLLGVRTDTSDLTSENMIKNDFIAYQELLELSDKEALQKVMNYPYPRYLYDSRLDLHKEGNFKEKNGVFVGGVGFITSTQRDVIAVLSEEYARMESVNTSIIFAVVGKSTLQVSVRSSNVSLDVGAMCIELFGDYGGGTSYKGGASIPLLFFSGLENGEKDLLWNVACKHMFRKVFKESWVDHEEE